MNILYRRPRQNEAPCAQPAPAAIPAFKPATGRLKIGFVSASAGAGATTLAFATAEHIAAQSKKSRTAPSAALLELDPGADSPAGSAYDKVGVDRRFAGREFHSFYRLACEGKPLADIRNLDGGLCFALRVPNDALPPPEPAALHRLLNNISADVILCDIPAQRFPRANGDDVLRGVLADLHHIVCVVDPLPSRLLASAKALETVRAAEAVGIRVTYVLNKLNAGVNLRETLRFTGIRTYISVPAIPAETVYAAEYACRSLADEPEMKNALVAILRP